MRLVGLMVAKAKVEVEVVRGIQIKSRPVSCSMGDVHYVGRGESKRKEYTSCGGIR